jgi:hypothetical protein
MRYILIVTVSLLLLQGCNLIPDLSFIGVDAQVGGNRTIDQAVVGGDEIGQQNINQNISPAMMLLMIAGWVLPTPQQMVGSVADFILRLFGRK